MILMPTVSSRTLAQRGVTISRGMRYHNLKYRSARRREYRGGEDIGSMIYASRRNDASRRNVSTLFPGDIRFNATR